MEGWQPVSVKIIVKSKEVKAGESVYNTQSGIDKSDRIFRERPRLMKGCFAAAAEELMSCFISRSTSMV
jgi:hypothetical protein